MSNRVFVDTAGWANLFVVSEPYHNQAKEWFINARKQGVEMVTTNYVVAEFVALLYSPLRVFPPRLFEYVDGIKTASYVNLVYIDSVIDDHNP
ncbi:MAG: hypothetical protein F6K10_05130 [Moorea sp. SIO2B7]|nr:hypothetical protein [Moorena sp. SIO2B7]